ncbi:iron chaperone [Arcicella rigui]|uniref:DUF1801 domain-containing protein n=1 Tax=Arcicella rigui TaxID=797020 RepID=A0ABU5QFT5_9BACT|nr:DUF1801 domain-containing protein [Arcicella rigui]MEA5141608.1 DUF1801 domain-containing protein [Arcicella rigui]
MMKSYQSIDEYIADFPAHIQILLTQMRTTIQEASPEATEKISYAMPTFDLGGNLVHFAAFKNHIGFYPSSSGIAAFQDEIAGFKSSKGAVQFPIGEALPLDLVKKIVVFRTQENLMKMASKKTKKQNKE